ncbi:MAG: hypothetical protein KatS3mg003_1474 [Candidatus Nitrosocaldaceae archaeon]|nr:MAG: hypothetical protein KatS3mg003_1474 [Candidatus Nitrosocaldaceae archaeon]
MELVEQLEATLLLKDIAYPFPEYKVGEGKIYLKTEEGSLKPIRFTKAVVKEVNGIYGKHLDIVGLVGKNFAVIPNQLVEDMVYNVKDRYNLSILRSRTDRHENAIVIDLLSDKLKEVDLNDMVQFGVSIRNSIDGTSSLAVDSFSYRLACKNGATAKVRGITFSRRHVGNPKELLADFEKALESALAYAEQLAIMYKKMVRKIINKEIAEKLAELNFPMKYYKSTPIRIEREDNRLKVELLREENLWQVFNGITYVINHDSRAGALTRSYMTHRLHTVISKYL